MQGSPQTPAHDYGRFAIFIDGSNLYHTIRDLGLHIDYRRLLEFFRQRGWLVRAFYYTALLEGDLTPDWLIRLTDWLAYNGFNVITKRAKIFRRRVADDIGNAHWVSEVKGNVDIELAVDMVTLAPALDTIVLFSGDGDFISLVESMQRMGVRVIVISSERTSDSTVADDLRRQADEFIELSTIADSIRMPDRPMAERPQIERPQTPRFIESASTVAISGQDGFNEDEDEGYDEEEEYDDDEAFDEEDGVEGEEYDEEEEYDEDDEALDEDGFDDDEDAGAEDHASDTDALTDTLPSAHIYNASLNNPRIARGSFEEEETE